MPWKEIVEGRCRVYAWAEELAVAILNEETGACRNAVPPPSGTNR